MWGWQCDRQTDKQATDRQATSVLATSDLRVKLGFDCLCEDRGTFGRRQASGRQAARLFQSFMHGRKTGRQAAGSQVTGGQTDRRQIDRRQCAGDRRLGNKIGFECLCEVSLKSLSI